MIAFPLLAHLRGHALLFDRAPSPDFDARAGMRLLIAAALVEALRIAVVRWLVPGVPLWVLLPLLLACALWAVPGSAGVTLTALGLRPWRHWTLTEKSYFVQVVILANVVFLLVVGPPRSASRLWGVFVPYLFYGFYQEVVYRGMVQSALVRRWGAFAGIVVANLLYTFGPLHSYYFRSGAAAAVPKFAAVFAIGLFFGILYRRSGNLWIVGVFHAIGNAYFLAAAR